jgi:predicted nucleic acid-binding protein
VLATPSVMWYEFLCGPVSVREIELIRALLRGGVITYGDPEATEAARLFNATGRSRRLRVDAMIAACALFQERVWQPVIKPISRRLSPTV